MKTLLYSNRYKTVHDQRFIELLTKSYKVLELYGTKRKYEINPFEIIDIFLCGPLTEKWPSIIKNFVGAKNIGISWGYDLMYEIKEVNKLEIVKTNLKNCDKVIVDCYESYKILRNDFNFKNEVLVVPYGCDFEKFRHLAKAKQYNNHIAILRSWTSIHNNKLILEAVKKISPTFEVILNVLETEDEEKVEIQKFMNEESDIKVNVYKSSENNYLEVIRRSGIYVSASKTDGTSITLLEAMASKLLVLAPNLRSNLEWIEDGKNGFTYNSQDIDDLSEKLAHIMKLDIETRRKIANNAQCLIEERANWALNKEKILRFIP